MIAIDNLLNNHDLTQIRLGNFMLLTKHKLNTKPQDKSFCLHVRGCGSPPQLDPSFVDSLSVSSSFFLLSLEKPLSPCLFIQHQMFLQKYINIYVECTWDMDMDKISKF